jgi:hypothetical protein
MERIISTGAYVKHTDGGVVQSFLSESISDVVSRAESDEVAGFVAGKGIDCDAKDFDEVMSVPRI